MWSGPSPLVPRAAADARGSPTAREFSQFLDSMNREPAPSYGEPAPPPPPPPRLGSSTSEAHSNLSQQAFDAIDTNKDGVIDPREFGRAMHDGVIDLGNADPVSSGTHRQPPSFGLSSLRDSGRKASASRGPVDLAASGAGASPSTVMRDIDERRRNLQADLAAVHKSLTLQNLDPLDDSESLSSPPPNNTSIAPSQTVHTSPGVAPDPHSALNTLSAPPARLGNQGNRSTSRSPHSVGRGSTSPQRALDAAAQLKAKYDALQKELHEAQTALQKEAQTDKDQVVDLLKQALIALGSERDQLKQDLLKAVADSDHLRDVNQALVHQCQMYKLAGERIEMDQMQHVPADIRNALSTMQKALHTMTLQRDAAHQKLLSAETDREQLTSQLAAQFVQPVRRPTKPEYGGNRSKATQIKELTQEIRDMRKQLPPEDAGSQGHWNWVSKEEREANRMERTGAPTGSKPRQRSRSAHRSRPVKKAPTMRSEETKQDPGASNYHDDVFDVIDVNADGVIDPEELAAAVKANMLPDDAFAASAPAVSKRPHPRGPQQTRNGGEPAASRPEQRAHIFDPQASQRTLVTEAEPQHEPVVEETQAEELISEWTMTPAVASGGPEPPERLASTAPYSTQQPARGAPSVAQPALSARDRQRMLLEVFEMFDLDHLGVLEPDELLQLGRMRRALGQKEGAWNEAQAESFMGHIDTSCDGAVSAQEFCTHYEKRLSADPEEFEHTIVDFMEVAAACRANKQKQHSAAPSKVQSTRPTTPPRSPSRDTANTRLQQEMSSPQSEPAPLNHRLEDLAARLDSLEQYRQPGLQDAVEPTLPPNSSRSVASEAERLQPHRAQQSLDRSSLPAATNPGQSYKTSPPQQQLDASNALFDTIDINNDGVIDADEFAAAQASGVLPPDPSMQPLPHAAGTVPSVGGDGYERLPRGMTDDEGSHISDNSSLYRSMGSAHGGSRDSSPGLSGRSSPGLSGLLGPDSESRHRRAASLISNTVIGMVNPHGRLGEMVPIDRLLAVLEKSQYRPFATWVRSHRQQLDPQNYGDMSQIEVEDAVVQYLKDSSSALGLRVNKANQQEALGSRKQARTALRQLYRKYAKLTTVRGATFEDISKNSACVDVVEFLRFLTDYDFIPSVMNRDQAKAMYYQSTHAYKDGGADSPEGSDATTPTQRLAREKSNAAEFEYCVEAFVNVAIEAFGGEQSRVPPPIVALQKGIVQARRPSPIRQRTSGQQSAVLGRTPATSRGSSYSPPHEHLAHSTIADHMASGRGARGGMGSAPDRVGQAEEMLMRNLRGEPRSQLSDSSALELNQLDAPCAGSLENQAVSGSGGADVVATEIFALYVTEGTRCMDVYSFTAFIESFDNSVTPQTAKSIFTKVTGSPRAQLEENKFTNWLIETYPDFDKTWGMS